MLYKGQAPDAGADDRVIEEYHRKVGEKVKLEQEKQDAKERIAKPDSAVILTKAELFDDAGNLASEFGTGQPQRVRIHYHARERVTRPQFLVELLWATEDYVAASVAPA